MKVPLAVVDTNVIVSGLINPFGKPGAVVDAVLSRRARLAWDDRIAIEYLEVLSRPRFGFSQSDIERVLAILPFGERVDPLPWHGEPSLDPADTMFLEVAAGADCPLVTGNLRHFPESCHGKVLVHPPAEWLEGLRG